MGGEMRQGGVGIGSTRTPLTAPDGGAAAAARLDDGERMTLSLSEGQSGVRGGPRTPELLAV